MARDLQYSLTATDAAIVEAYPYVRSQTMFPNEELQRWAGRICLLLGGALGMMGYHFANVRFLPLVAGFAILAGVCYIGRGATDPIRSARDSGQHPAL